MSNQNRVQRGVPSGGQWAQSEKNESGVATLPRPAPVVESWSEDEFFETFGTVDAPDGGTVWNEAPEGVEDDRVWTVVDSDDGGQYLVPGRHWVDRAGYVVSEQPREHDNMEVRWMDPDPSDAPSYRTDVRPVSALGLGDQIRNGHGQWAEVESVNGSTVQFTDGSTQTVTSHDVETVPATGMIPQITEPIWDDRMAPGRYESGDAERVEWCDLCESHHGFEGSYCLSCGDKTIDAVTRPFVF